MSKTLEYHYEHKVTHTDLDELNHVNNVVYVQWIQDAAVRHWNLVAPEKIKNQFVWVIVRHEIDYHYPAVLNDLLLIKTHVLNASAVSSERLVQIYRKADMKLLVESKTRWCMIDAKTHRPARITNEIRDFFL